MTRGLPGSAFSAASQAGIAALASILSGATPITPAGRPLLYALAARRSQSVAVLVAAPPPGWPCASAGQPNDAAMKNAKHSDRIALPCSSDADDATQTISFELVIPSESPAP